MLNKLLADEVMEEEKNPDVEEGAVGVEGNSGAEKTAGTPDSEAIQNTQWAPEGDGTGQALVVKVIPGTDQGHNPETGIGEIIVHAEFAPEAQGISGDDRAPQTQGISHNEEVPEAMEILEEIDGAQEADDVMEVVDSEQIPELEKVSMVGSYM